MMIVVYSTNQGTRWFYAKSILKELKTKIQFVTEDGNIASVKKSDIVKIWKEKEQ